MDEFIAESTEAFLSSHLPRDQDEGFTCCISLIHLKLHEEYYSPQFLNEKTEALRG